MAAGTIPIIDCDVHAGTSPDWPLDPYIPKDAREALRQGMGATRATGFANPFGVIRRDQRCNDPHETGRNLLDRYGMAYAVLLPPGLDVSLTSSLDMGNALARAWNDWQISTWLAADDRYLGSVCVNVNDPPAAAAEIRRAGEHGQMVQVVTTAGGVHHLYGHRCHDPIYEACQELGLPFAMHAGREGAYLSATPVGQPTTYFEWHTNIPLTYQAHLVSLVLEGVFERFPGLKVVLVEGGVSWLAPVLWRMDKNFKALRSNTPWLRRPPSEYVTEHIRLTTQPIEEPSDPDHLLQVFDMIQADKVLCFASDFPHWDFDDPHRAFPRKMSDHVKRRIFYENAAELYRLPGIEAARQALKVRTPADVATLEGRT